MKTYGINYWFGYPLPGAERFELIRSAGFGSVMLWWGPEYTHIVGNIRELAGQARQAGLAIENVHATSREINEMWINKTDGSGILADLMTCISDCAELDIPTAVIHLTSGDNPPPPGKIGLDRFKHLVEHASKKGVNIALENLRRPDYLDYVFANIKADCLGFCYDSGHEHCYSPGANLLDRYGDRLMALHLHDNDGSDDQHRIPGEGTIDWPSLLRKLEFLDYQGPLSLKVTNEFSRQYRGLTPEGFLKSAYEQLSSYAVKYMRT